MRKPAISAGNGTFSAGTGPRAGPFLSDNLRRGTSRRSASFFHALEGPGTAQGGGVAGRTRGPGRPENLENRAFDAKRAAPPAPEVSSSRRKRAGFAAHGEIIADAARKGKGARCANGALNRAEINAGPVKSPVLRASITAIAPGRSVTRRYSNRADKRDTGPRTSQNEAGAK